MISVPFSAVVVCKKIKTRTRKESSVEQNDMEYNTKTKSVSISGLNSHRYSSEGRLHRGGPLKIATELTAGVGSEQFHEKPESMSKPFGNM